VYTIIHISDIHRSTAYPFANDEIVSALHADIARAAHENPPIDPPDAIIVSGDLVQGLPLGSTEYPDGLREQYRVAFELFVTLAETFVAGDRSKIVLIPGNHDVDFNKSLTSMDVVDVSLTEVHPLLHGPEGYMYRWNWKEGKLYRIRDWRLYEERFWLFNETYNNFYQNVTLAHKIDPRRYYNLFELCNGEIAVCAFNSCYGNDCFSYVGEIPAQEVSTAYQDLSRSTTTYRLRIAVWHHDLSGPPKRSDYMDQDTVKLMIDRGYRLGFHGHQHKSDAAPYSIYTSDRNTMAIVSSGSLCAGAEDIPGGVARQYNIVQIADGMGGARVHVRESKEPKIFSPGRFISLGNRSYEDVSWTPYVQPKPIPAGHTRALGRIRLAKVDEIEHLLRAGEHEAAIAELDLMRDDLGEYGRRLRIIALTQGNRWPELATVLSPPTNADEATRLIRALVECRNWPRVDEALTAVSTRALLDEPRLRELSNYARAERMLNP
jgi:Calcineurin-like phosphoesterase